jgi:hypothetical protein
MRNSNYNSYQRSLIDEQKRTFVQGLIAQWVVGGLKPIICTYATRPPAAESVGTLAYNTDAGDFEASDGVNWIDREGVLT